jgi:hypothetical protein
VYLAHQVRQNTKSLRAENYARVLDRLSAVQSNLSADAELNRIVIVGAQAPDALTRQERVRFTWALYELMGAGEFVYHQAQQGGLPEEVWERWRQTLAWWISHPGIQTWWAARPSPFSVSFERFMTDLMKSNPLDTEAVRRWERFVAGSETNADPGARTFAG